MPEYQEWTPPRETAVSRAGSTSNRSTTQRRNGTQ